MFVLLLGVLDSLAGERILQFGGDDGNAVEKVDEIEGVRVFFAAPIAHVNEAAAFAEIINDGVFELGFGVFLYGQMSSTLGK